MRRLAAALLPALLAAVALTPALPASGQVAAPAGDCVSFGRPKPTTIYDYRRRDSNGTSTQYSHRWTEFTDSLARVSVIRGKVNEVVANRHKIENDVTMIASTASRASNGSSTTNFRPAVVGDPMFRACAGRSWKIRAVAATHEEGGRTTTANTYAGSMKIVSLRETITVPAGRFECVRYVRTLATPGGQSVDEYWKSIEYGVVVKQVSKLAGWTSTAELQSIK